MGPAWKGWPFLSPAPHQGTPGVPSCYKGQEDERTQESENLAGKKRTVANNNVK